MSDRFYASEPITGDTAVLSGDEAHHLAQVMRAKVGDEVVLFDGSGVEFVGRIASLSRKEAVLAIVRRIELDRMPARRLTLGVALPKGERQKWLVEKAAELGVAAIVPLATERGVAEPTEAACERLWRTGLEAAKQCGRNRLLEIGTPASAAAWFASVPRDALRIVAHPTGDGLTARPTGERDIYAAIGPEGGFTPAEIAAAQAAGWQMVSLGERILRVETAAIAIAAIVLEG